MANSPAGTPVPLQAIEPFNREGPTKKPRLHSDGGPDSSPVGACGRVRRPSDTAIDVPVGPVGPIRDDRLPGTVPETVAKVQPIDAEGRSRTMG